MIPGLSRASVGLEVLGPGLRGSEIAPRAGKRPYKVRENVLALGNVRSVAEHVLLLGDDAGSFRHVGVTAGGDLHTFAHRTLTETVDVTLNDSDKTITVPANRLWWIHLIHIDFTSSAVGGDRVIRMFITTDGTNSVLSHQLPLTQAASLIRRYTFAPTYPENTSFNGFDALLPLPSRLLIPAGGTLRILDNSLIDPTADDMLIRIQHDEIVV